MHESLEVPGVLPEVGVMLGRIDLQPPLYFGAAGNNISKMQGLNTQLKEGLRDGHGGQFNRSQSEEVAHSQSLRRASGQQILGSRVAAADLSTKLRI